MQSSLRYHSFLSLMLNPFESYIIIKKLTYVTVFLEVLSHIPWDCLSFDSDLEYAWTCLKDLFFSAVSEAIPTVKALVFSGDLAFDPS